nr:reverse transcriptase domain-containing protein [Tanacetum cinerariifolium]
ERMESVFHISNCAVENQVKFATCTLHSVTLTWGNTHVKTVGHEAAYGMPWKTLMKMMTEKYCPRNEIRKLEMELWDLKVKGTDLASYTQRYQELSLLCERMFSKESDKIEKYIGGLPDMIHGSVVASKPKTMQEAIEIATELMDKKIRTFAKQKYMMKGLHIFLAHITTKEVEDKSEKKRIEDVPIVRNFPEVFPEDLSGLPLTRLVEFQIDLVPGAAPVARAPYR